MRQNPTIPPLGKPAWTKLAAWTPWSRAVSRAQWAACRPRVVQRLMTRNSTIWSSICSTTPKSHTVLLPLLLLPPLITQLYLPITPLLLPLLTTLPPWPLPLPLMQQAPTKPSAQLATTTCQMRQNRAIPPLGKPAWTKLAAWMPWSRAVSRAQRAACRPKAVQRLTTRNSTTWSSICSTTPKLLTKNLPGNYRKDSFKSERKWDMMYTHSRKRSASDNWTLNIRRVVRQEAG